VKHEFVSWVSCFLHHNLLHSPLQRDWPKEHVRFVAILDLLTLGVQTDGPEITTLGLSYRDIYRPVNTTGEITLRTQVPISGRKE
jgi:hypothetical protein